MFGKRSILNSGKLAKRKRRVMYLKVMVFLVLIVGAVAGSAYGLSRPEIFIKDISVHGTSVLTEDEIRGVAEQVLSGTYFFIFPKRNVVFFPRRDIEASVRSAYERVSDIDVSRDGMQGISIAVTERKPYATWCTKMVSVPLEDGSMADDMPTALETCYFLDDGGYVFAEAPRFSGDVYFRYYGLLEEHNPIGSQYMSESRFRELSFFLTAAKKFGVGGVSFTTTSNDVELRTKEGMVLRFGGDDDFTSVLNILESVLTSEVFKDRDYATVEYIDLRFGDRVFYQFRE
jgi:hypothetical protein